MISLSVCAGNAPVVRPAPFYMPRQPTVMNRGVFLRRPAVALFLQRVPTRRVNSEPLQLWNHSRKLLKLCRHQAKGVPLLPLLNSSVCVTTLFIVRHLIFHRSLGVRKGSKHRVIELAHSFPPESPTRGIW